MARGGGVLSTDSDIMMTKKYCRNDEITTHQQLVEELSLFLLLQRPVGVGSAL